jgi:hypothetical protein
LAFPIITEGEADLPEIWAEPLSVFVTVLKQWVTYQQIADHLPNIERGKANRPDNVD